jgi:hypothetical protein
MWIHEKDTVKMGNKKLVVTEVYGIYSSIPASRVTISLQDTETKETHRYSLLDFNKMHDDGRVVVDNGGRVTAHY